MFDEVAIGFSLTRTVVFIGKDGKTLVFRNAGTGTDSLQLKLPGEIACGHAVDGTVVVGLRNGGVVLYRKPFKRSVTLASNAPLVGLRISEDGRYAVGVGSDQESVFIWDLEGNKQASISAQGIRAAGIVTSHSILVARKEKAIRFFDLHSRKDIGEIQFPELVEEVAWSPDGTAVAVASEGKIHVSRIDRTVGGDRLVRAPRLLEVDREVSRILFSPLSLIHISEPTRPY